MRVFGGESRKKKEELGTGGSKCKRGAEVESEVDTFFRLVGERFRSRSFRLFLPLILMKKNVEL